ncbi:MAG: carboxypeptidase-like regulatory domain-containing protein [Acidobacteria bacterium]|nr:carboxypeptidase-like regulatory domain-containing protein [Acidobacteriota bacterium]
MTALLLAGLSAPSLSAQAITQTVQGLVTDATGAVIPGASVTVKNIGTGLTQTTQTNDTGNYSFPQVQVGNYTVSCTLDGFKTETVANQRVETGAQVRLNFAMEIGDVTETVEVSAAAVTLNTENAVVGSVVENKRIIELPLNGRNVVQLAVLVPGVQYGSRSGMADGQGGFPIPGSGYSVSANGQRGDFQVVSLDGVDAKDPRIHITNFVPSIEAIEEFKIQTNAYSAEVGFGGGAVTSITMKSGTNELHGTLFEFLRNEALDAEAYFLNFQLPAGAASKPKDQLRRNQYGVVVSGPIVKNKTFWAFNWEGRRERTANIQQAWFPSQAFRNGDFSQLLTGTINPQTGKLFRRPIVIYDPLNGQPFANNMAPASRIHPGSTNVMSTYLPLPGTPQVDPLDFTDREGVVQPIDDDFYFGRVDHHFSDSDRVFGRLAWSSAARTVANINPVQDATHPSDVQNLASSWVHTFGAAMINDFRFGLNRAGGGRYNIFTDDESFNMDSLGIGKVRVAGDNNRELTPLEHGIPSIGGARFSLGSGGEFNQLDTYQFGNHLSWIAGSHNLKAGGEVYHATIDRGAANLPTGRFSFSGNETGDGFASWLIGLPNRTETAEGWPRTVPLSNRMGFYINDDWKASSKLTLNLGLRYDYLGNAHDRDGLWRTVDIPGDLFENGRGAGYTDPATGKLIPVLFPTIVNVPGSGPKLWEQETWRFFMPRVGIAYRPTEKWVIRTGGGWFDNIDIMNTWTILNLNPPLSGSTQYDAITNAAGTTMVTGADGQSYTNTLRMYRPGSNVITFNDPFFQQTGGTRLIRPINTLMAPPDRRHGAVMKWSFDIQRELPFDTSLTIGYVGSKGTHTGNSFGNFNTPQPSSDTNINPRRPFPFIYDPATPALGVQGLATIRYLDSFGNSFHQGLQIKLDKRFSRGLAYGVAYTYSKSLGDGESGGQEGASYQNAFFNRNSEARGRYRFDQQHNMVTHWVWEMPGQNMSSALRHILGGWQNNGILSLRSGFPFTVGQGGDLNTGGPVRPDRIADGRLDNPTRQLWFDPSAFQRVTCNLPTRPDLCRYGSSGYNILDSPGQVNLDFGFFKNFEITESTKLQFRWELFNAMNTPYFRAPGGISFSSADALTPDGPRNGEVTGTRTPMRIMQFGLKFFF